MKQRRRRWTTYSGRGKRVAARTHTARDKAAAAPRMLLQLIVCGVLFVALVGLKLLLPGNLSALRGTLGQWLVRDADFVSAFSAVGARRPASRTGATLCPRPMLRCSAERAAHRRFRAIWSA